MGLVTIHVLRHQNSCCLFIVIGELIIVIVDGVILYDGSVVTLQPSISRAAGLNDCLWVEFSDYVLLRSKNIV